MKADPGQLLSETELVRHSVVANCQMNRQRGLLGVNSYAKDLGMDIQAVLAELRTPGWLDVCCGEGRALLEAAELIPDVRYHGLDLVAAFAGTHEKVRYSVGPISGFRPSRKFGFITCVHGLHYVGDKLGALQSLSAWLADDGLFVGHFDLESLQFEGGDGGRAMVEAVLGRSGYQYNRLSRILKGQGLLNFEADYLGADPNAGPNFTGQPAVNSHYRLRSASKESRV